METPTCCSEAHGGLALIPELLQFLTFFFTAGVLFAAKFD
jgi:hypothetical protein